MPTETIRIPTPDGAADALLVRPDDAEHPGVLLYPDAYGLRPAFQRIAERVASWGYTVLVPNLFYRLGTADELAPTGDLRTPEGVAAMGNIRERITSITPAETASDAAAYIGALRGAPGVAEGDVATAGYCFGGLQAVRAAESLPDEVAATAAFHTSNLVNDTPESAHRRVGDARAEFYLAFADDDPGATPEQIATLEAALRDAGREFTSEVYPGARHGYAVTDVAAYQEAAAERHFAALHDLLDRSIGAGARTREPAGLS